MTYESRLILLFLSSARVRVCCVLIRGRCLGSVVRDRPSHSFSLQVRIAATWDRTNEIGASALARGKIFLLLLFLRDCQKKQRGQRLTPRQAILSCLSKNLAPASLPLHRSTASDCPPLRPPPIHT